MMLLQLRMAPVHLPAATSCARPDQTYFERFCCNGFEIRQNFVTTCVKRPQGRGAAPSFSAQCACSQDAQSKRALANRSYAL